MRGQKRTTESSKSSEAGADEVYARSRKFYKSLEFLSDPFTPRKTKSNANDGDDGSPYVDAKPSTKTSKKLALAQNNELHRAMSATTTALESVISSKKNQKPQEEDVSLQKVWAGTYI